MKYHVRLTDKAEADVETVLAWFAQQQADVAGSRWVASLMAAIDTLESSPQRCGLAVESEDVGLEIRELLVGRRRGVYRILFQIHERTVFVLRIRHSARNRLTRDDL